MQNLNYVPITDRSPEFCVDLKNLVTKHQERKCSVKLSFRQFAADAGPRWYEMMNFLASRELARIYGEGVVELRDPEYYAGIAAECAEVIPLIRKEEERRELADKEKRTNILYGKWGFVIALCGFILSIASFVIALLRPQ